MQIKKLFFSLLKCELCGMAFESTGVTYDFARLMKFAEKFDLAHLIADALIKNEMLPDDETDRKKCSKARLRAVYRDSSLDCGLQVVKDVLADNGIEFIPLKGSVIKDIYPETWMRTRCDIDILVHANQIEQAVEVLGKKDFVLDDNNAYAMHVSLKCNDVHVELHRCLNDGFDSTDVILSKAWEYACKKDGFEYVLTPEYITFHFITHMRRHLIHGGCGIRPFADIYLMKKKKFFDEEKLKMMLTETKLMKFYDVICNLIEHWFEGKEKSKLAGELENYILNGGIYGSTENHIAMVSTGKKSKLRIMLDRVFLDYETMYRIYPKLKDRKVLLPVYYVIRIFGAVFGKNRKGYKEKVRILFTQKDERVTRIENLVKNLEIGK